MMRFREPFDWELPAVPRRLLKFEGVAGMALLRCCRQWESDYSRIDPDSLIPFRGSAHYPGLCPRSEDRSN